MSKFTIILNPVAGRGESGLMEPVIREKLDGFGLDYSLVRTTGPWHAAQLARQAALTSEVVVSVGGDGTANEVLNGLLADRFDPSLSSRPPGVAMGLLPIGRGNDFGFGVGIPHSLDAAIEILAAGKRRGIDVGFIKGGDYPEGRYFGNGIGVGFDAVVGFEALKLKRLSGFPSYIIAALKTIFLYYKAPLVEVSLNEGEKVCLPALMVSVMNGRRMGGGFMMAPESENHDGLFDVCMVREVSKPAIMGLIPQFMKGTQGNHPAVRFVRTTGLGITAIKGTLPVHADGETICVTGLSIEIRIVPQAIEMVTT
jgi:YegS/Rv2252/BmrU family lipid kinase